MKKKGLLPILFVLISLAGKPQYFSTGEDPAFLKWRQIVTRDFQLIYPEDFEEKARVMAAYFEKVYDYGSVTLNHRPRKISVIFHTRTVRSNGLVGWAPKRMELFTPPHQEIYAQDWLQQLVLHEFRHVVQVDKIRSQIPPVIRALLGEHAEALITGIYLPFWFLEGDAVIAETALSTTGRGRLPSFLMEHKAQVVEKGVFSFDKAFNGSYRDFVPDHYKLGYHLVGETRARYGSLLWDYTIDQLSRKPLSITPVNKMLKLLTGKNQEQLYLQVFDSLHREWTAEDRSFRGVPWVVVTKPPPVYASYRYNHILPSGEIVTLKTSYDHLPRFVRVSPTGEEETVFVPGQIFEESVGYRNNLIVWSEFVPDVRWNHSGKSIIRIFDVDSKEYRTLIPEYKCFAPSISPDEHNVSVVETDFKNHYYLSVYNSSTGALVVRYRTPDNNYLFSPVWKNDRELFAVVLNKAGKQLALLNPFEGRMILMDGVEPGEIKQLCYTEEKLFYIDGRSGKNALWSVNLTAGEVVREAEGRFGLEYPAVTPDGKQLIISDFTADGFRLVRTTFSEITSVPLREVSRNFYPLAELMAAQEPGIVEFTNVDTLGYISKPYRKAAHLINLHSWAPVSLDMESFGFYPGFSVVSQNKLGTAEAMMGYKWKTQERTGQAYLNFEYRGWYPIFRLEGYTGRRASEYNLVKEYQNQGGQVTRRDTVLKRYSWDESGISLDMRVPLDFTRGRFYRILQPEVKLAVADYRHRESTPGSFISGDVWSVVWRLYFHQLQRKAVRDIQPKWGWILEGAYRHTPFGDNNMGSMRSAQAGIYLPGFTKTHGTYTYLAFQDRTPGDYSYSDAVSIPRGWHSFRSTRLVSASVRYVFPLLYPDLNLGKFIYFRRIKAALFYDAARMEDDSDTSGKGKGLVFRKSLQSLGADLTADSNFLRFYAPVDMGIRAVYLPEGKRMAYEFLLSVDFNSF